jgi:hypothetical protein
VALYHETCSAPSSFRSHNVTAICDRQVGYHSMGETVAELPGGK